MIANTYRENREDDVLGINFDKVPARLYLA